MLIHFIFLTVVTFAYVAYVFFLNKEHKKISFIYSFSILTIFYTPSLYFFMGGEVYRFFSDKSLIDFFNISILTISIYLFLYMAVYNLKLKKNTLNIKNKFLIKLYFLTIIIPIVLYYIIYFKQFPLVYLLLNGEMIDRPDLTGAIPHFYTVSTIVSVVVPSIYFFYFRDISKKYLHFIINVALIFLFIASGNKGFVVYYFIFIWLYIFNAKFDFRIIFIFFFLMFVYMLTKGITELNYETLEYMANSPFRRFFVSQGTGFIHRVDMVNEGFDFLHNANPRGLKFDVFAHMYNTNIIGSAPTFYTGDIYAQYGLFLSLLVFIVISLIVLYSSKYFFTVQSNRKLFFYWNIYAILFFIVMAEINFANTIRGMVGIFNILLILFLNKLSVKEKYAK